MFANVFDNGEFHGSTRQDGSLRTQPSSCPFRYEGGSDRTIHTTCPLCQDKWSGVCVVIKVHSSPSHEDTGLTSFYSKWFTFLRVMSVNLLLEKCLRLWYKSLDGGKELSFTKPMATNYYWAVIRKANDGACMYDVGDWCVTWHH